MSGFGIEHLNKGQPMRHCFRMCIAKTFAQKRGGSSVRFPGTDDSGTLCSNTIHIISSYVYSVETSEFGQVLRILLVVYSGETGEACELSTRSNVHDDLNWQNLRDFGRIYTTFSFLLHLIPNPLLSSGTLLLILERPFAF